MIFQKNITSNYLLITLRLTCMSSNNDLTSTRAPNFDQNQLDALDVSFAGSDNAESQSRIHHETNVGTYIDVVNSNCSISR